MWTDAKHNNKKITINCITKNNNINMTQTTEQHFLNKVFASSGITKDELQVILPKYKQ